MPISTTVNVRVIAKGGKFLGADISGATVTIHNHTTGQLLASGTTSGGSGDIWQIMVEPRSRTQAIPTIGASVFSAVMDFADSTPVQLRITATGPGAGLQSQATTSTTIWIVPGLMESLNKPAVVWDCLLELPGLILQVQQPATHSNISKLPADISFSANVAMMCGCPIDNGTVTDGPHSFPNPWPVADFKVGVLVMLNGNVVAEVPLNYLDNDIPGLFVNTWQMTQPGFYTAAFYAYQYSTGNTGAAAVSFFNIPAAK